MDTEGTEQKSESATVGTVGASQQTRFDDSRAARDQADAGTVDATRLVSGTETDGPPSTAEINAEAGDRKTVLSVGSTRDADRTPNWESQATATEWVESTLAAWMSTVPVSSASDPEVVPGFEILGELGCGGMGVVYKARQERLRRLVALKMIRSDWHGNPEHLARFEIEAEAVARLNHPNILRIYEIGRSGRAPFVVLELLEGGTLKERLAGNPQPFREAAALLAALARGVSAAHVAGILHRDLKPSNVLFDRAGVPKIADFGLAKRLEVEDGETQTGQVLGTPSYMAPEQAKGWDKAIGPAADIYSLGAILYETLTGRPPLKGTTPIETIKLVQEEDPVPPSRLRSKLPFDLETICLKCIARDPRKRYPDALSLAEDLDRFLNGESILARRTPLWERGIKQVRKRPARAILAAVAIVAAGITVEEVLRAREHARITQKRENERVITLLDDADHALDNARRALATKRWNDVRVIATRVLRGIERESDPRIIPVRDKVERLHAEARLGLADQSETEQARARFRQFIDLRDEAHFLDAARFADGLENSVEETSRAARAGLAVFGHAGTGDDWALSPLPRSLSAGERDEVTSGFYQMLLILADAVSQSPGAAPADRGEEALRIVSRVEGLRSPATRAYHLRRAYFLEMKGDREESARERDAAERLAPADAVDSFLIGREAVRRSDWPAAIAALYAARQRQHDFFWADCLLAICYLQTNQPAAARAVFDSCLLRKPDRAWLYMLRGIASAGVARAAVGGRNLDPGKGAMTPYEAAEADYRTAFERLDDRTKHAELHYAFLLNRGMMRLLRDDLPAAVADFQEAIRVNGRRFEAFADLGQAYQRQGLTDDALKEFAKAIELRPNWAPLYRGRASVILGLRDLSAELRETTLVQLEDAIRGVSAERRDAASRDLAEAIRHESPADHLVAADLTKQAALFHVAQRHDEALKACNAAIAIADHYPRAHNLRIRVLLDLKQYDDLIRSCDVMLTWARPSAEFYEVRGIAKSRIEDFSGAIGDFTRALDLCDAADKSRLRRLRGWSNLANDAYRTAAADFDEAIRLAPASADAYLGRGTVRARLGQYRDAESDAGLADKLGDGSARFTVRVARIYSLAAGAVIAEARDKRQDADRLVSRYQELAVRFVASALERTPIQQRSKFFHETILTDPAMQPIRRRLNSLEKSGKVRLGAP